MQQPRRPRELEVTLFILVGLSAVYGYLLWQDWFQDLYAWLWTNTSGRPFTAIIRDQPWLFGVPAAIGIILTFIHLPKAYWARALIIYHTFIVGFIGGHLFWP